MRIYQPLAASFGGGQTVNLTDTGVRSTFARAPRVGTKAIKRADLLNR